MTYQSIKDPLEPIQIPSGKGYGANHFCAGADLDLDDEEDDENEMTNKSPEIKNEEKKLEIEKSTGEISIFKKCFFFICGIESSINEDEVEIEETKMDTSIDEDPYWSRICDINAIIAMSLAAFSFAFFNNYN